MALRHHKYFKKLVRTGNYPGSSNVFEALSIYFQNLQTGNMKERLILHLEQSAYYNDYSKTVGPKLLQENYELISNYLMI